MYRRLDVGHCNTVCCSKKINMLILGSVAYAKIWLINSTVLACSSVVRPVFVALIYLWLKRDTDDHVGGHCGQAIDDIASFPEYALQLGDVMPT